MRAHLALGPVGAEPGEVERAQLPPDVLLRAPRPQRAEAHVVMRARRQPAQRVDVQVQTLVTVGAVPVAHEEVALGHLAQVVLVQELAVLALLAQAAQPVLADERVETPRWSLRVRRDVPLGAARAVGAVARLEGAAYGAVGGQADLVGSSEEGGEVEVVGRGRVVEDGRYGRFGRWGRHVSWFWRLLALLVVWRFWRWWCLSDSVGRNPKVCSIRPSIKMS